MPVNIDVEKMLDSAVTVYHKTDAKAAGTKADVYTPFVVKPAYWHDESLRTVDADGTAHYERIVKAQLPLSSVQGIDGFAVAVGDVIAQGERVGEPMGRAEMMRAAGEGRATVKSCRDLTNGGGVSVPPVGVLKYASVWALEGS